MSADSEFFKKLSDAVRELHQIKDDSIREFSLQEIAKHNIREDCWIILDGKVYDVSSYLKFHPGSAEKILQYGGDDATVEFKYWMHSKNANKIKDKFCIGIVKKEN